MSDILLAIRADWDEARGVLVVKVVKDDGGAMLGFAQSVELQIALLQKFEEGVPGIGQSGGNISRVVLSGAVRVGQIETGRVVGKGGGVSWLLFSWYQVANKEISSHLSDGDTNVVAEPGLPPLPCCRINLDVRI